MYKTDPTAEKPANKKKAPYGPIGPLNMYSMLIVKNRVGNLQAPKLKEAT